MTPYFKSFLYAAALVVVGFVVGTALFGCSTLPRAPSAQTDIGTDKQVTACTEGSHDYKMTPDGHRWYLDCVNASQSWDQENLKRNDQGCPTAIFVAPNGVLTQCQAAGDAKAPEKPVDHTKYFKTVDEAAVYVVGKIYELSHYYEFGGVIVKTPKGYSFAQPATQHHGMDVSFDEDPESYGYPIVATYHVHPCLKNAFSGVFSPQDLAGTRVTGHPGYVLDECTGDVHVWAPGDGYLDADAMLKLGISPFALMQGVQLSAGKVIGHLPVDGTVLN